MQLSGATPPRRFWLKRLFLPRSLLGRVLLIMVTPLILMQGITVWVFYDRHWDTITRRLTDGSSGVLSGPRPPFTPAFAINKSIGPASSNCINLSAIRS